MLQYKIIPEWLIEPNEQPFKIINVDTTNVLEYENDIRWLINSFHKRYEWDGFPDWKTVINRLQNGNNIFFLCEYNTKIIGWVWFRKGEIDISKDYIKFYTKTDDATVWGFNNFLVSNKITQKPEDAGTIWCSLMFKTLFDMGMNQILVDVESWQNVSIKMCEGSGMKLDNWVTKYFENA
jgi:hypothetical protein